MTTEQEILNELSALAGEDAPEDAVSRAVQRAARAFATPASRRRKDVVGGVVTSAVRSFVDEASGRDSSIPPPPHLGSLVESSPAFASYVERKIADSQPILPKEPIEKARDWQLDFGPASMPAGTTNFRLFQSPQGYFRGEKMMATDTADPPGSGTMITTITVGQKVQRPTNGATLTSFFAATALANGLFWDSTNTISREVSVTVTFLKSCTFSLSIFGKAWE